jgi:endonuclease G, mitochondrial
MAARINPDPLEITAAHRAVYERVRDEYLMKDGVTGVDLGLRYRRDPETTDEARYHKRASIGRALRQPMGTRTREIALRIHVEEWISTRALEEGEIFPDMIDDVPVNVIEGVYRPNAAPSRGLNGATPTRTRVADPLRPGVSISHPHAGSGTLGLIVYDNTSGKQCMLSAAHVLVGSDGSHGDAILQPGRTDGGREPEDRVAQLGRFIMDEDGDAAVAAIDLGQTVVTTQWNEEVEEDDRVVVGPPRVPVLDEIVEKSGVGTDVTRGRIDGIGRYKLPFESGSLVFMDGFRIVPVEDGNPDEEEISSSGDSGACWYAQVDNAGLGLHVAGEVSPAPAFEHAIACHLTRVFDALDIALTPPPGSATTSASRASQRHVTSYEARPSRKPKTKAAAKKAKKQ